MTRWIIIAFGLSVIIGFFTGAGVGFVIFNKIYKDKLLGMIYTGWALIDRLDTVLMITEDEDGEDGDL